MIKPRIFYYLTLAGFCIVLFSLIIWPVCCTNDQIPLTVRWLILVTPLLFPIRGLLQGNSYTFAWSHFLALLYFIVAIVVLWQGEAYLYGYCLLIGSLCWFAGALMYIRAKARQSGASG